MAFGAGDGTGKVTINGVTYSNGSFLIQKNESYTSMGVVGDNGIISFMDGGELWLRGTDVLVNGRNVLDEIDSLKSQINNLGG